MDVNQIIQDTGDLLDPANRNYALGAMQQAAYKFLAAGDTLEVALEDAGNIADSDCEHSGVVEYMTELVRWAAGQGDAFTGWNEQTIRRAVRDVYGDPADDRYTAELEQELILNYQALMSERGLWSGRAEK
jgi:hypothetical protein